MPHLPHFSSCMSTFRLVGIRVLQQGLNLPSPGLQAEMLPSERYWHVWLSVKNNARHQGGRSEHIGSKPCCCAVILSVHRSRARSGEVGGWRAVRKQMLFWVRREEWKLEKMPLAAAEEGGFTTPGLVLTATSWALDHFVETQRGWNI